MTNDFFGLLALVKPAGPSSAAVVERVRRLTGVRKVGHAGTLDPAADGVLVLAFGRATGCFPYLPTDKAYRATVRLGATTDTQDGQGKILASRPIPDLGPEQLESFLARFRGSILQRPPLVSALHHQGRRLYDIARAGETVDVPVRTVEIRSLTLVGLALPDVILDVACSRGTYIRSLASDLGEAIGCGAHLAGLTRTLCSGFPLETCLSLEQLEQSVAEKRWAGLLVDVNQGLRHLPELRVDAAGRRAVLTGRPLPATGAGGGLLRIVDSRGRLLAVAEVEGPSVVMRRVFGTAIEEEVRS